MDITCGPRGLWVFLVVLGTCLGTGVLVSSGVAILRLVTDERLDGGISAPGVGASIAMALIAGKKARSERLTISTEWISVVRDNREVILRWLDFERVEVRRWGPVRIEELVFREGYVEPLPGKRVRLSVEPRRQLRLQRVRPGRYFANWRRTGLFTGVDSSVEPTGGEN